jgi:ribosomal protein S27E
MIRPHMDSTWRSHLTVKHRKEGYLIDVECIGCQRKNTLPYDQTWKDYRSIIFNCASCNNTIGTLFVEE